MNWDAIGAVQIRQGTTWQRTQAFHTSTSDIRRWAGRIIDNAEVNEIYLKGRKSYALFLASSILRQLVDVETGRMTPNRADPA